VDTDLLPNCPAEYIEVPHRPASEVRLETPRVEKDARDTLRATVSEAITAARSMRLDHWDTMLQGEMEQAVYDLLGDLPFRDALETLRELCGQVANEEIR
jgi:hypothetical protein